MGIMFEDARRRKSKDRQTMAKGERKKKEKNNDLQNTRQKIKGRVTR